MWWIDARPSIFRPRAPTISFADQYYVGFGRRSLQTSLYLAPMGYKDIVFFDGLHPTGGMVGSAAFLMLRPWLARRLPPCKG